MSRKSHAHPVRQPIRHRVKYAVLTRFPLRLWWRLPASTRDWWVEESQRRNGWTQLGRLK